MDYRRIFVDTVTEIVEQLMEKYDITEQDAIDLGGMAGKYYYGTISEFRKQYGMSMDLIRPSSAITVGAWGRSWR